MAMASPTVPAPIGPSRPNWRSSNSSLVTTSGPTWASTGGDAWKLQIIAAATMCRIARWIMGELMAELRVASVLTGDTLATIAERAFLDELERLRAEFNGGRRFPMPAKPMVRRGRPPNA